MFKGGRNLKSNLTVTAEILAEIIIYPHFLNHSILSKENDTLCNTIIDTTLLHLGSNFALQSFYSYPVVAIALSSGIIIIIPS